MNKKILITIGIIIITVVLLAGWMQKLKPTTTAPPIVTECGNGICETGENGINCPKDCCVSGDGVCRDGCISENDDDCKPTKVKAETICTDGLDNDGDGLVDNEDRDCWIREGAMYETHPYYYGRSFKPITEQIPALADLGVKTIWLMPFMKHVSVEGTKPYHYWILDHYKIDPRCGTEEELKKLVATAHRYNMRVIGDLVTAATFGPPAIVNSSEKSVAFKKGWVHYIPLSKVEEMGITLKHKTIGGKDFVYYKCGITFTSCELFGTIHGDDVWLHTYPSPHFGYALDRTNPEVIDYFTKVAEYWIREYDLDGWRIDAPGNAWNPELIQGDHSSVQLIKSVKEAITRIKPDAILFGETPCLTAIVPVGDAAPVLDEFLEISNGYYIASNNYMLKVDSREFVDILKKENIWYNRLRVRLIDHNNLPRISKTHPREHRALVVMMSTVPGIPLLQAGAEIGTTIAKFHKRGLAERIDWKGGDYELREFYQKVFRIRNHNNALKYGSIKNVWKSGDNTYAYVRGYEDEKVVVVINFLDKTATSEIDLSFLAKGNVLYDELNNERFTVDNPKNFKISVPKYGSRILTLK